LHIFLYLILVETSQGERLENVPALFVNLPGYENEKVLKLRDEVPASWNSMLGLLSSIRNEQFAKETNNIPPVWSRKGIRSSLDERDGSLLYFRQPQQGQGLDGT